MKEFHREEMARAEEEKRSESKTYFYLSKIMLISRRLSCIHWQVGNPEIEIKLEEVMNSSQQNISEGVARKIELWRAFSAA